MFKDIITTKNNQTIYLEYDKNKYDIEYKKSENSVILKRLWDNEIVEIFDERIGFIVQVNSYDKVNIIVTDYSDENRIYFKHYKLGHELKLIKKFECDSASIQSSRISDNSFIVEQKGYGGIVYCLNGKQKKFDYIYRSEKNDYIFENNILIGSHIMESCYNHSITDKITYGIDPESFDIVTLIWSELQQRSIKVKNHTKEVAEAIKWREKINERRHYLIPSEDRYMLEAATIDLEVGQNLEKLALYLDKTEKISFDNDEPKINSSFIKKLTRK